jgi:hypothetical protein
MSEYQYYEFLAMDRPLNQRQLAELRTLSSRARITATSFVNTYEWGNFHGDPRTLIEGYFDAFLYLTNWNTRELMIRLPKGLLEIETAATYCAADSASAWVTNEHVVVDLNSQFEDGAFDEDGDGWLTSIIPVRADMAAGDLRALYLGWLLCLQADELADDDLEPPVPANLTRLTPSLRSLVEFLRIDEDLLAVAAATSPESTVDSDSDGELARFIEDLPMAEKDVLLLRTARGDGALVRGELLRRIRQAPNRPTASDTRRTVAELLNAAAARRGEQERLAAERKAIERANREREAALAYERRLQALQGKEETVWQEVHTLIEARKPAHYDQALQLLKDLQAVGRRNGCSDAFDQRVQQLRDRHLKKVSLLQRLDRLGL